MEKELQASEGRRRLERERLKFGSHGVGKRKEEELADDKRSKVAETQRVCGGTRERTQLIKQFIEQFF